MDPAHETAQRAALSKEALRIMEDTEYSGAQHFVAGQRWRKRATRLGLPATILISATSTRAGLSALVGGIPWVKAMDDDAVRAAEAIAYVAAGQTAKAFERWDIVFGHQFPAYG